LLSLTPSGRIPFVTVGTLRLYETVVVADYFARELGWQEAYPVEPELGVRHRIAIRRLEAMWGSCLDSVLQQAASNPHELRVDEDLDALEDVVVASQDAGPNMLLLAAVLLWLRFEDISDMAARVRERPRVVGWLDRGAQLEVIRATTPDAERVRRVHALG